VPSRSGRSAVQGGRRERLKPQSAGDRVELRSLCLAECADLDAESASQPNDQGALRRGGVGAVVEAMAIALREIEFRLRVLLTVLHPPVVVALIARRPLECDGHDCRATDVAAPDEIRLRRLRSSSEFAGGIRKGESTVLRASWRRIIVSTTLRRSRRRAVAVARQSRGGVRGLLSPDERDRDDSYRGEGAYRRNPRRVAHTFLTDRRLQEQENTPRRARVACWTRPVVPCFPQRDVVPRLQVR